MLQLVISVLEETLGICPLDPESPIPGWAARGAFFSATRTRDELSLILPEGEIPPGVDRRGGWRCLRLEGPLDLAAVGVLASVLTPLAQAQVSILALSTYETDYVLVRAEDLPRALRALAGAGHQVRP